MVREQGEELSPPTTRDTSRYRRQQRVHSIGPDGQEAIRNASALIVGVGALGCHTADALARAGIGRLMLVDRDIVEIDNLHRQTLFDERDATGGEAKATAAANRLRSANQDVEILDLVDDFQADTWDDLPFVPDVVVDGTDNFTTRMILNDLALRAQVPFFYGGAVGTQGRAATFRFDTPAAGPCLRCLLPDAPATTETANCETAGILQPVVAMVAAFQTAEVLAYLCQQPTASGIFEFDVARHEFGMRLAGSWEQLAVEGCPSCIGHYPALDRSGAATAALCGRDAVQVRPGYATKRRIPLEHLATNLGAAVDGLSLRQGVLRFAASGCDFSVFQSGRALIRGTRDPLRARALYERYVGTT